MQLERTDKTKNVRTIMGVCEVKSGSLLSAFGRKQSTVLPDTNNECLAEKVVEPPTSVEVVDFTATSDELVGTDKGCYVFIDLLVFRC